MPGLFGYIGGGDHSGHERVLAGMRDLLVYAGGCNSEPFFSSGGVCAGYCAPAFEAVDGVTAEKPGAACWFDGEIYNFDELAKEARFAHDVQIKAGLPPSSKNIKGLIIAAYQAGALNDLLRNVDGYFAAVVFDQNRRQIKLLTDRFGFGQIFYANCGENFIWASEYKAFSAVPGFGICVDRQSVDDFMKYGVLCDNRTWLEGVYLLDQASVLTYDIASGAVSVDRYWSPDEIRPLAGKASPIELYEEWGRLFRQSVAERTAYSDTVSTGLTLSGGLDSRAILAAMPEPPGGGKINAATYGPKSCYDIRFAAMAAKMKGGVCHHIFPVEANGWLKRAILGIWATDGGLDLSSQLGFRHFDALAELFGVCLNGIGGGTLHGRRALGSSLTVEHGRTDIGAPGLHMLRRRMIRPGFRLDESFFRVRMPFFSNALYEFVMALPDVVRVKRSFYADALLHNFPQYYKKIPWQQPGVPISLPRPLFNAGFFCNRIMSRAKRKLHSLGFPVTDPKLHFNISEMMRHDGNRALATSILAGKNTFYQEYLPNDITIASANIKTQCRVLTFEIWMRQLHAGYPYIDFDFDFKILK
jgi:asparagine synthase (glutamine-hydrolysing)